ncbi:MAG: potB [Caulobacter sp.]|nr:potB [Caulobacter sp.]
MKALGKAGSKRIGWPPLAVAAPFLWLAVFFAFPFLLVLKLSFSHPALAMPPYAPKMDWSHGLQGIGDFLKALSGVNYRRLTQDDLYFASYLSSLRFAAIGTAISLLIGYPIAYAMARCGPQARRLLLMAVILPFWTSFLIRVYAWIGILKPEGLLNAGLHALGLPGIDILNTDGAVYVGLVYAYLPFMMLPLYAALERLDPTLLEAAADLGASPTKAFWSVTVPLSLPGVAAGCLLCFIPMVGEFVIPDLLGGPDTLMIGKTIWTEFFSDRDWPSASAVAIILLVTLVVPILLYQRQQARALEAQR